MSAVVGCPKTHGFTLIELLIAMSLTVLIGALAYRFLDASIRVQEQGETAQRSLTALEQTWQLLASDLRNSIDRPVVTPATGADFLSGFGMGVDGQPRRPSMMSAQFQDFSLAQLMSSEGALLWFSRQGWVNPMNQQRSEIQRILYRLDDNGNLYRDYWPERNQELAATPEGSLLLLENVRSVRLGFLVAGQSPDNNAWLAQWPPAAGFQDPGEVENEVSRVPQRYLPAAVRISVEFADGDNNGTMQVLRDGGTIERLFLLAGF